MFEGDTIYSRSTVLDKRESRSTHQRRRGDGAYRGAVELAPLSARSSARYWFTSATRLPRTAPPLPVRSGPEPPFFNNLGPTRPQLSDSFHADAILLIEQYGPVKRWNTTWSWSAAAQAGWLPPSAETTRRRQGHGTLSGGARKGSEPSARTFERRRVVDPVRSPSCFPTGSARRAAESTRHRRRDAVSPAKPASSAHRNS